MRRATRAAKAVKFELPPRLPDRSDKSLLGEIRRVAALVDHPVLTMSRFDALARISSQAIIHRFGSWHSALKRAGAVRRREAKKVVSQRARARSTRYKTNDELVAELHRIAKAKGTTEVTARDLRHHGGPDAATYMRRFGSWAEALLAAGLRCNPRGRHRTDEECFQNLLKVWKHRGRAPIMREMYLPPSTIGWEAYVRRFGNWRKALEVFAARAKGGSKAAFRAHIRINKPKPKSKIENRQPSLALRYAVLSRDRFKCTACGMTPALHSACALHVDHIVPVSKGGRTELGNLRTLCSLCNTGKGTGQGEPLVAAAQFRTIWTPLPPRAVA